MINETSFTQHYTEEPVVGFRLRAFTKRKFGVVDHAQIQAVGRTYVTLKFPDGTERVDRNRREWFMYPPGHARDGQWISFAKEDK